MFKTYQPLLTDLFFFQSKLENDRLSRSVLIDVTNPASKISSFIQNCDCFLNCAASHNYWYGDRVSIHVLKNVIVINPVVT